MREALLGRTNATAAVIGAGDFIGGAIAKKFASEGFTVFAGRRHGDRLAPPRPKRRAGGSSAVRSTPAKRKR